VRYFQNEFKKPNIIKQYIAKVQGLIGVDSVFEINDPMICIQQWDGIYKSIPNKDAEKQYMELCSINGVKYNPKPSITKFQVLHRDKEENISILLCSPLSGRSHQIREHLLGRGYPVVGEASNIATNKSDEDYLDLRTERGSSIWDYKLGLFEKYGIDNGDEIIQTVLSDLTNKPVPILDDLCLFSYRYKVGDFDFRSEIDVPSWIKPPLWNQIKHKIAASNLTKRHRK